MSHAPPLPAHRSSPPFVASSAHPERRVAQDGQEAQDGAAAPEANAPTEADRMEARLSQPPIAAGVAETTAGAAAGAAIGAFAGPLGMVAGAVVGAAAGAIAASAVQDGDDEKAAHDLALDEEIGVLGGELGAPNLKHPPARIGAFSAASSGASLGGRSTLAEGPIPAPGEKDE